MSLVLWAQSANATLVQLTSPAQLAGVQTQVDWGVLGGDFTDVGATPNLGPVTASGPSRFATMQQAPLGSYDADFADGASLLAMFDLLTGSATAGTITVTLSGAAAGFGFQLANGILGQAFTAEISAFGSGGLLGTFSYNHTTTNAQDGSALFVGLLDSTDSITSFTISGLAEGSAMGDLTLVAALGTVPVPGTLALVLPALLILLGVRRRGWA